MTFTFKRNLLGIHPNEQENGNSIFIHVEKNSPIHINVCVTPTSRLPAVFPGLPEHAQVCVSRVLSRSPLCHSLALAFSFCCPLLMKVCNRHLQAVALVKTPLWVLRGLGPGAMTLTFTPRARPSTM